MGTTSEKLTYLNETKQELKQAINNLGGEITDETTFREYTNQLQEVYDRLPKTEYGEGTEVTIENGLKGKIDFKKEYQQVEYIESSGTQYIDTGITPDNTLEYEIKFNTSSDFASSGTYGCIFGSRIASTSGEFQLTTWTPDVSVRKGVFGFGGSRYNGAMGNKGTDQTSQLKNHVLTGASGTENITNSTFSNSYNIYLFALNQANSATQFGSTKIYYMKLWKNNVLVRDFIPCYRTSDNVIGMYDKVNKVFYINAGTWTFTKGENVGNGFIDVVGIGQNEQDSTKGYQLLNINASSFNTQTQNGVTITNNGDGSVTLNGTSTNSVGLKVSTETNSLSNRTGTFILKPNSSGTGQLSLVVYGNNGTAQQLLNASSTDTSTTFTTTETYANFYMWIWFPSGRTFTNYTIKPMIESGTTAHDWEKYTGGYSSPSPNWKQEIKYVRGKNLFDSEIEQGGFLTNGLNTNSPNRVRSKNYIKVEPNTTYTINASTTSSNNLQVSISEYTKNDYTTARINYSAWVPLPYTFTTTNECRYIRNLFRYSSDNNLTPSDVNSVQLEEGTQAHPYLPYNTIQETIRGKNDFDIGTSLDDWFQTSTNGTKIGNTSVNVATATISNNKLTIDTYNTSGWNWISKWITLGKNTDYIISGTNDTGIKVVGFTSNELQSTGTEIVSKSSSESTKTFNSGDYAYYCLSMYPGGTGKYIENIQIEQGSTATTYEPYVTPRTYQFSLGNNKFYKIGDYADELVYDVDEDKVYKNEKIGELALNGSENYTESSSQPTSDLKFYLIQNIPDAKYLDGNFYVAGSALSNYLSDFEQNDYAWGLKEGFLIAQNGMNFCISNMTLQEFKSKLQQNNMYVYYITNATKEIPITDTTLKAQVKAWYNAQSNNGTTILESNGDLPMIIKVRALKGE